MLDFTLSGGEMYEPASKNASKAAPIPIDMKVLFVIMLMIALGMSFKEPRSHRFTESSLLVLLFGSVDSSGTTNNFLRSYCFQSTKKVTLIHQI